jgi:uncharacterized protein YaiI (UPF0178 family)
MPNIGGPKPFSSKDRSNFLNELHVKIEKLKRDLNYL